MVSFSDRTEGIYLAYYRGYAVVRFAAANAADIFISSRSGLCDCFLVGLISNAIQRCFVLQYIERISLTVLCAHLFALEMTGQYFKMLLDKIGLQGNTGNGWYIVIHVVVAVAGACNGYFYNRTQELLKSLLYMVWRYLLPYFSSWDADSCCIKGNWFGDQPGFLLSPVVQHGSSGWSTTVLPQAGSCSWQQMQFWSCSSRTVCWRWSFSGVIISNILRDC